MDFVANTAKDQREMLAAIGVDSVDELFADIPRSCRLDGELDIPAGMAELEVVRHLRDLAGKNRDLSQFVSFLGGGAYDHYIPSVVDHIISRSEYYTAYTPYQAEVSQGTLQTIYEFQTMITELTGMEIANASVYDGASAVAEAALMAVNVFRGKRSRIVIAKDVNPHYREVLRTYAHGLQVSIEEIDFDAQEGVLLADQVEAVVDDQTACLIFQQPNFFGHLASGPAVIDAIHASGALAVVAMDPISAGVVKRPGDYGADIVVGEGQPLGNPLSYGGPYLGFFATREKFLRQMPGRLSGRTVDEDGQTGYVMTLQTREQHIRRERATSNICTNQALNATAATVYLSALGKQGLGQVGTLCLDKSHYLAESLKSDLGLELAFASPYFKEFTVQLDQPAAPVLAALLERGYLGGVDLGRFYPGRNNQLLVCVTEKRTRAELDAFAAALGEVL